MSADNLETTATWEIWYQDTFDRETPRQVELAGQGLVAGLVELWARHLAETVQANGQEGFSRFNLWWEQANKSIEILDEWDGQVRLRGWVIDDEQLSRGYAQYKDNALLNRVATAHKNQVLRGRTSEAILALAKSSPDRQGFEQQLLGLE